MTSPSSRRAITLTRRQIESIIHNMGWEPEDAETFLKMAKREMRDPGILDREEADVFRPLLDVLQ